MIVRTMGHVTRRWCVKKTMGVVNTTSTNDRARSADTTCQSRSPPHTAVMGLLNSLSSARMPST